MCLRQVYTSLTSEMKGNPKGTYQKEIGCYLVKFYAFIWYKIESDSNHIGCDRANANLSKRKSSIALIFHCKYVYCTLSNNIL